MFLYNRHSVINKFFDTEGRINNIIEIILQVQLDEALLDTKDKDLLKHLIHTWENVNTEI